VVATKPLLGAHHIAEGALRGGPSFARAHAFVNQPIRFERYMRADLFGEVIVGTAFVPPHGSRLRRRSSVP
jgi:hypothetical protein